MDKLFYFLANINKEIYRYIFLEHNRYISGIILYLIILLLTKLPLYIFLSNQTNSYIAFVITVIFIFADIYLFGIFNKLISKYKTKLVYISYLSICITTSMIDSFFICCILFENPINIYILQNMYAIEDSKTNLIFIFFAHNILSFNHYTSVMIIILIFIGIIRCINMIILKQSNHYQIILDCNNKINNYE